MKYMKPPPMNMQELVTRLMRDDKKVHKDIIKRAFLRTKEAQEVWVERKMRQERELRQFERQLANKTLEA